MTEPTPAEEAVAHKQAIVQADRERKGILDILRNIGKDIRVVERRVADGYDRADRERRK